MRELTPQEELDRGEELIVNSIWKTTPLYYLQGLKYKPNLKEILKNLKDYGFYKDR